MQWQYLTTPLETGNSIVIGYELQQEIYFPENKQITAGQNFETVQSGNNNYYVVWQTQQGPEYRYRVRAKNIYGLGQWSDTLIVPTGTVPETPARMVVINPRTSAVDGTPNVK